MFPLNFRRFASAFTSVEPRLIGFDGRRGPLDGAWGRSIGGAAINSRTLRPGDLFFALRGARTDGHAHVADAMARGACAAATTRPVEGARCVVVRDVGTTLTEMARWNRRQFAEPVVAVAGSHGKTTFRELLHLVLSGLGEGVRSRENFNNALGVPLTLCELGPAHRFAAVEVGANRPGEIAVLCELARPTLGVLTGIGSAHVGSFGGPSALRAAKAELFDGIAPDGLIVVNGDDPVARSLATASPRRTIFAGTTAECDVRVEPREAPHGFLRLDCGGTTYRLRGFAPHMATLAACAIAVAKSLDVPTEAIRDGLAQFQPLPGRGRAEVVGGVTLVDDTYNAPPEGFLAAVDLLASWPVAPPGRRWLLCGGMSELGADADRLHARLGRRIAAARPDRVLFVGSRGARVADAADLPPGVGRRVSNVAAAADRLAAALRPGDVLLAKGCRADGLERALEIVRTGLA